MVFILEKRHIGFEIKLADNLIKRSLEATKPKELDTATGCHSFALRFFAENADRDIFQKDFERQFDIRRSTASSILSLMEKNGLITRQSVESDARLKKIVLTEKALEIHKRIEAAFDKMEKEIMQGISVEDAAVFFATLDTIKSNIERMSKEK